VKGAHIEQENGAVTSVQADVPALSKRRDTQSDAQRAFARAAQAELIEGNAVRLLKDAEENYPAWLEAIRLLKVPYVLILFIVTFIINMLARLLVWSVTRGEGRGAHV